MIEATPFQIDSEFLMCLEILTIFPMVEHILRQCLWRLIVLITPPLWSSEVAQIAQSVTEVSAIGIVKVGLQGISLLCGQVLIDDQCSMTDGFGKYRDALGSHALHLCRLLFRQIEVSAKEHHSIVATQPLQLFGSDIGYLYVPTVIIEHEVGLL